MVWAYKNGDGTSKEVIVNIFSFFFECLNFILFLFFSLKSYSYFIVLFLMSSYETQGISLRLTGLLLSFQCSSEKKERQRLVTSLS